MYIHFTFLDGSNPYITTNHSALWRMIKKYYCRFTGPASLLVEGRNQVLGVRKVSEHEKNKTLLRDFALDFQSFNMEYQRISMGELIEWGYFFEEYGKRFGLLREFRENGLC